VVVLEVAKMATIGELPSLVISVVIIGVIAAIGLVLMTSVKDEIAATGNATTNPTGYLINASVDEGVSAVSDVPGWLGIIVIVIMGALIIRLLMGSFGNRGGA
jgi:sugar phosphate permease